MTETWVPFLVILAFGGMTFFGGRAAERAGQRRFTSRSLPSGESELAASDAYAMSARGGLSEKRHVIVVDDVVLDDPRVMERRDEIYHEILQPVIESVGLASVRADAMSVKAPRSRVALRELINSTVIVVQVAEEEPRTYHWIGIAKALRKRVVVVAESLAAVADLTDPDEVVLVPQEASPGSREWVAARAAFAHAVTRAIEPAPLRTPGDEVISEYRDRVRRALEWARTAEQEVQDVSRVRGLGGEPASGSEARGVESLALNELDLTDREYHILTSAGVMVAGDLLAMSEEELRSLPDLDPPAHAHLVSVIESLRAAADRLERFDPR